MLAHSRGFGWYWALYALCFFITTCALVSVSLCAFVRVGEVEIKINRLFAFFLQRRDSIFVGYDSIFLKRSHHCDRASILISLSLSKLPSFFFVLQPPGSLFVTLLVVSVFLFLFSLCCSPAVFFFDLPFSLLFCPLICQKFGTIGVKV